MSVKTAERMLDLIELFALERRPLSLSNLAARLEMPNSSTHALINTLLGRGYLYQTSKRLGYFPTRKLKQLSDAIADAAPLLDAFGPRLARLRDATGETILLTKRQGDAVINLDVYESAQSVRFFPRVGELKPLHSTASGKAVLGTMPEEELVRVLARLKLERHTEYTITDRARLATEVARGRRRGWYRIIGENIVDLMSLAVPLQIGGETYAITIGGPTQRVKPKMAAHVERLLKTRAALLRETGSAGGRAKTRPE